AQAAPAPEDTSNTITDAGVAATPPVSASPSAVIDEVKEKLEHAAKLAQALQDNPEVLRFMNALFAHKG
ncbi:hypothetical protein ACFL12_04520, partial [Pseudomonadota bacterium]